MSNSESTTQHPDDLPQRVAGDTLPAEEQAELLAIREARRVDAEAAAERARTGNAGGIY